MVLFLLFSWGQFCSIAIITTNTAQNSVCCGTQPAPIRDKSHFTQLYWTRFRKPTEARAKSQVPSAKPRKLAKVVYDDLYAEDEVKEPVRVHSWAAVVATCSSGHCSHWSMFNVWVLFLSPACWDHPSWSHGSAVSRPTLELQTKVHTATRRFVITEKASTRAFSWLKAPTSAFTFKTLWITMLNQPLPQLVCQQNYYKGQAALRIWRPNFMSTHLLIFTPI